MKLKVNHEFGSQGRSFRNNAPVPPKYKVYRKSLTSGNNANIFNHFKMSTIENQFATAKKYNTNWFPLVKTSDYFAKKNLEIVKIEGFVGKY